MDDYWQSESREYFCAALGGLGQIPGASLQKKFCFLQNPKYNLARLNDSDDISHHLADQGETR